VRIFGGASALLIVVIAIRWIQVQMTAGQ